MTLDVAGWQTLHPADYWLYDKLILSRKLGYVCGPSGMDVPQSDIYCVRPIMNMHGMGINARFEHLNKDTNHLHPGEFWCEMFYGEHISVDYLNKTPILTVRGEREVSAPVYQWKRWTKIKHCFDYPEILNELQGDYPMVNCEFIAGHLIEVHLRHNPDFNYKNKEAIPVWDEKDAHDRNGYTFIRDPDYKRIGFLIK